LRIQGSGFRVQGAGFGFRAQGAAPEGQEQRTLNLPIPPPAPARSRNGANESSGASVYAWGGFITSRQGKFWQNGKPSKV